MLQYILFCTQVFSFITKVNYQEPDLGAKFVHFMVCVYFPSYYPVESICMLLIGCSIVYIRLDNTYSLYVIPSQMISVRRQGCASLATSLATVPSIIPGTNQVLDKR